MYFNVSQRQNFTDKNLLLRVEWSSMLDVEFYRLYYGLQASDLTPCLCRDVSVIFAIFTKVCSVFCYFCRDFILSLSIFAYLLTQLSNAGD